MSVARTTFCKRISEIRETIQIFDLSERPLIPANQAHNNSTRLLRNGLAIQCFNTFEDFLKQRTAEALTEIEASGVDFSFFSEDFQRLMTVDALRSIQNELKKTQKINQISFVQDCCEDVGTTKASAIKLPKIAVFHYSSNISADQMRDCLKAFGVQKPWEQISSICSALGLSAVPSQNVFVDLAGRRHKAAHNASTAVTIVDLNQSIVDSLGLALGFDVLLTKTTARMMQLSVAVVNNAPLISFGQNIVLRCIKYKNFRFGEYKIGGIKCIKTASNSSILRPAAELKSKRENGALAIFDLAGILVDWFV